MTGPAAGAGALRIEPLTPQRAADWAAFFDHDAFADNPRWQSCYCHFLHADENLKPWPEWTGEENRRASLKLIDERRMRGLLAYKAGKVVGWVQAAAGRTVPALEDLPVASAPDVGCVLCFVVAAPYRRQGVARALLDAACADLRSQGLRWAMARPNREAATDGAMHMGPLSLYLEAGFEPFAELDEGDVLVRRAL